MVYNVVMPQLSDSMEEGKLIEWKKKVGDTVKIGDVIAEVESDKAIMEVQTFHAGVIKELLVKEGSTVPVKTVIAKIESQDEVKGSEESTHKAKEPKESVPEEKKEKTLKEPAKEAPHKKEPAEHKESAVAKELNAVPKNLEVPKESQISPKAKELVQEYGVDIKALFKKYANETIHSEDVIEFIKERYFTPKARQLLDDFKIDFKEFTLEHKIDTQELEAFIQSRNLSKEVPINSMQKAIIANVTASAQKPIYHIYESLNSKLLEKNKKHSITAWLVKIFAKVMMQYESFRSKMKGNMLLVSPNANISVAVADAKNLYMPVIKGAQNLSIQEISQKLEEFKSKLQSKTFRPEELSGGNFGISNLGMLKINRFDAMINQDESGIVAVGAIENRELNITLTIDHRLINGYEAALFVKDLKEEMQNPQNFEEA